MSPLLPGRGRRVFYRRATSENLCRFAPAAWPHPVIANGRLCLRDQDALLCYDIKAK